MRSDFFKAAERLANMSGLRLTLPAPDHTPKDRISRDSRRETTHTNDTISPPEPDTPAPGAEPPNERPAASPPEPKNLNLIDHHPRPVLASATTGEPPYPHSPPSLAHAQQSDPLSQPFFLQQDYHSFNQETRAGVCAPQLPFAAHAHPIITNTFDDFLVSHFAPWPEHIGWPQGHPHFKGTSPTDGATVLLLVLCLEHRRRGWGLPRPLRKVGHVT
jgi:hypothetical protein